MDRLDFIKQALDVNSVKAAIVNELISDIPDDKLAHFFAYRLNFVEEKMSVELITKKAIFEYKRLLVQARLKRGEIIFKSVSDLKKYLLEYYKGKEITNGDVGSGFLKFVVIGLDKDGDFINKNVRNDYGRFLKLNASEEARFLHWLLNNQERIGVIDYDSVAKKEEILQSIEIKQEVIPKETVDKTGVVHAMMQSLADVARV